MTNQRSFAILSTLLLSFGLLATADYQLVWSDEFNGDSLDNSKWNYETTCDGGGNNELQCYTNRRDNVQVRDGNLYVIAKPEEYGGKHYTSGRINTKGHAAWKYGRFDIRAKIPKGDYLWPALWMLPQDSVYGGWAASGEIDIMEARGQDTRQTQATLHHGGAWPNNVYDGSGAVNFPFDFSDDFHIFSAIWERDQIQFLVDGKVFSTQNLVRSWYSGRGPNPYTDVRQPFDQQFFFIINNAVGGGFFGGQANALNSANNPTARSWPSPALVVDYVRVFQDVKGPVNPIPIPSSVVNPTPVKPPVSSNNNNNINNNNGVCAGRCGAGGCCNDQRLGVTCFDSNNYVCSNDGSGNGKQSLCGKGLGACSAICYDTNRYKCENGAIHLK